ncbi:MAG: hypothetical protein HY514_01555 [Candidatus Aenigmarchaeota archaeon]|nr:hypothetical protein [Candidatus Aenigmarchaeota archaeon]
MRIPVNARAMSLGVAALFLSCCGLFYLGKYTGVRLYRSHNDPTKVIQQYEKKLPGPKKEEIGGDKKEAAEKHAKKNPEYEIGLYDDIAELREEFELERRGRGVKETSISYDQLPSQIKNYFGNNVPGSYMAKADINSDGVEEIVIGHKRPIIGGSNYLFRKNGDSWEQILKFVSRCKIGTQDANGFPVIYTASPIYVGPEMVGVIEKNVFDGEKYKTEKKLIESQFLEKSIRNIAMSTMSDQEKQESFEKLEYIAGPVATTEAMAASYGINTGDRAALRSAMSNFIYTGKIDPSAADINFLIAMEMRRQYLSSPTALAIRFVSVAAHEYFAAAREEEAMTQLAHDIPAVRQFKDVRDEWPSYPEILNMIRLGGAYSIPVPSTPYRNDGGVIGIERSEGPYGGTERRHIAIGTPEQVERSRRDYAARDRQRQHEQRRQESYDAFRRDAGRAADAARQGAGQAGDALGRGASEVGRRADEFFKNITKPPEERRRNQ